MTLSRYGRCIRKIRADFEMRSREMAARLGYRHAYLMDVENNRQEVTDGLITKIIHDFTLTDKQIDELVEEAYFSKHSYKLDMSNQSEDMRHLCATFAKMLSEGKITPDIASELIRILEGEGEYYAKRYD